MRKLFKSILITVGIIGFAAAQAFTPKQVEQIQQITKDYLIQNPEVLVEASKTYQGRQIQKKIAEIGNDLFTNPNSPTGGNKLGKRVFVEFFDYNCPHCQKMHGTVQTLMQQNPEVRFVFKELPIFGEQSVKLAEMALAANVQGKYLPFHEAMMASNQRLNETTGLTIAKKVGLDMNRLKKDMDDPKIQKELKENQKLAQALGLQGTPAYVVSQYPLKDPKHFYVVPGRSDTQHLQQLIDATEKP